MKALISIAIISLVLLAGVSFGYKQAINDSAALGRYIEMGNSFTHVKILDDKGEDALREFLIDDIRLTTSIHKSLVENQSFLSSYFGPENENIVMTNRKEYYEGIKRYYQSLPDNEKNQLILRELEWLLKNLKQ